jgi:hypothetical protein
MIIAAVIVFLLMILFIEGRQRFFTKRKNIWLLAFVVVVIGMLIGKYGAKAGLPWWIYYPVPMLCTLFLPPAVLKFSRPQTIKYILLSFLSAPFIHACFSFFLGWKEYMPFWNIPSLAELLN